MRRFMYLSAFFMCLILILISSSECYAEDTKLTIELISGIDNFIKELKECNKDLISWSKVNMQTSEVHYVTYTMNSIIHSTTLLEAIETVLLLQYYCSCTSTIDKFTHSMVYNWQKQLSVNVDLITNYSGMVKNPVAADPCIRARSQIRKAVRYIDKILASQE